MSKGFTLIELMIVTAVVAILAAIAYPSYLEYIAKARRADAKTVLLETTQFLERYYTQNGTYLNAALPYAESPKDGESKFYDIAFKDGSLAATTYILQATPKGAQANDKCGTLIINQTNQKSVSGASYSSDVCWIK